MNITLLILSIAAEIGVLPYFALAIALCENPNLNPHATHTNDGGTVDRGIMQLNSSWYKDPNWDDPETNIRAGCEHIKWISGLSKVMTYWTVAVCYNAGTDWLFQNKNPPARSIKYADEVMKKWRELDPYGYKVIIHGK